MSKLFVSKLAIAVSVLVLSAGAQANPQSWWKKPAPTSGYQAPKNCTNCVHTTGNTKLKFVSTNTTVNTKLSIGGSTFSGKNVAIGSYNLLEQATPSSPITNLVGFCVDPYQSANKSLHGYTKSTLDASDFVTNGLSQSTRFANAQKLFDNAYAGLSTIGTAAQQAVNTAGFHIALWEVFFDDNNVTTGGIKGMTGTNTSVLASATSFLSQLASWKVKDAYQISFFKSICDQDFVTAKLREINPPTTVPLPAALPLFLFAICGFGLMSRRRM